MDLCGTPGPAAPMRNSATMVAWTPSRISTNAIESKGFRTLATFALVATVLVVITGAYTEPTVPGRNTQYDIYHFEWRQRLLDPGGF
jgi:hypothetical protein